MNNPYTAPMESSATIRQAPDSERASISARASFSEIARRTFLAWEKLRLVYVAICGSVTLLLGATGATEGMDSFKFWGPVIVGGVIANVFYFAGPLIETYVTWLGLRAKWLRWTMFTLGTVFTVIMAMGSLVSLIPSPL